MLTRGGILIRNPRLLFNDDPDNPGGGNQDPGFPKDTPVKEMSAEQQAAYWQDKARKHESRVKAFGDITPEKLQQMQQDAEKARLAALTEAEQAIEKAREEGRAEVRTVLGSERFKTALATALTGRTVEPLALIGLDQTQFINGDNVNREALTKWIAENSTEVGRGLLAGGDLGKKTPPNLGQGRREQIEPTAGEMGKAEAARRFAKSS